MPKQIFAHSVLLSTAHHLLDTVEKKKSVDDEHGIALECIACLVMCAACVEALANFVGQARPVEGWIDRASLRVKIYSLYESADLQYDEDKEPLKSLNQLRQYRNSVMHSRPEISDDVELDEHGYPSLDISWSKDIDPALCRFMFDHVKLFQRTLFDAYKIEPGDEMTFAIAAVG